MYQSKKRTFKDQSQSSEGFIKKKLKLELAQTVFVCQCTKNFLSFPSIYSHCKIKHGIKISSKLRSGSFKRQIEGNQQRIIYQLKQNQHGGTSSDQLQQEQVYGKNFTNKRRTFKIINKMSKLNTKDGKINIYGAISNYLRYYTDLYSHEDASRVSDILLVLTQCINSHYMIFDHNKIYTNYCRDRSPQNLPLFLNFLVTWYLPTKDYKLDGKKIDLTNICQILADICNWLKNENLTQYEVCIKQTPTQITQEDSESLKKKNKAVLMNK